MRFLRRFFVICIFILAAYYIFIENKSVNNFVKENISSYFNQNKISIQFEKSNKFFNKNVDSDFFRWINSSSNELIKELGEPKRTDLSAYGYTWWIYDFQDGYIQFGIDEDNKVETIYARGFSIPLKDMENERSYDRLREADLFKREINFGTGLSSYTFHLTDDDIAKRPLIHIAEDIFMQLYFDTFTKQLSSFRILKGDTLLKHIPYELQYRGKLPEKPDFNDQEWEEIERGMEQQIFDLTNIIRSEFQINYVGWEESLHEVAFLHSKDMADQDYFSHYDKEGNGLKERLAKKELRYQYAGENIAAQYTDGLAAVEGWLNSKGHREAILDGSFTHLGVGVYRLFYTQNFIKSP